MNWLAALGVPLTALAVVTIGAMIYFVARFVANSGGSSGSMIDEYLRSGRANPNPSHMPPTYTYQVQSVSGVRSLGTSVQLPTLDPPDVQRQKFEASQTTTAKELRNIDR